MCKDIKYLQRGGLAPHKDEIRAQTEMPGLVHCTKPFAFQLLAEQIQAGKYFDLKSLKII